MASGQRFEEEAIGYPRSGDAGMSVTVTGGHRGVGGLDGSYSVFLRRNARLGEGGRPVKGWEHPESQGGGVSGPYDLRRNEQELQEHLRSYGRYLESLGGGRSEWGSKRHLDRVGGGYEGSDFMHRDPLPSNSYSVKVVRKGGGKATAAEREYAARLNDYWNYLQAAHGVTGDANRRWNEEWDRKFPDSEVERKG